MEGDEIIWIPTAEMGKQLGVCASVIAKAIREKEGGKI